MANWSTFVNFAGEAARVHSNACRHDDDAGRTVRRESKREEQLLRERQCATQEAAS